MAACGAPPAVTGASGGLSASNGRLTISGTAAPNATVTISGPAGSTTVTADASGKWTTAASAPYVLAAPGAYTLTITQSGGGSTTVTAKYALPPLTVSQPATADQVVPASFTVTGSSPLGSGQIVVADGDGRSFVERAENKANVNANGTFTVNVGQAAPRLRAGTCSRSSSAATASTATPSSAACSSRPRRRPPP